MLCRNCAREIPDNSVFCNWCGERQIKERKKDEIRVSTPAQLPPGIGVSFAPIADFTLLETCIRAAGELEVEMPVGNVLSSDTFYDASSSEMSFQAVRPGGPPLSSTFWGGDPSRFPPAITKAAQLRIAPLMFLDNFIQKMIQFNEKSVA